jgi:peptide/nickel transport system ATP-binding protein
LLEISDLRVSIGAVPVLDTVSCTIARGESYVLLGESGCGKSMTALSIMRLLAPGVSVTGGAIRLLGENLLELPEQRMREVRGRRVAMIFQEPQSALNPVLTAGTQVGEVLVRHAGMTRSMARRRAIDLFGSVGISEPRRRVDEYPHQLSGGVKQRVMIAMALAGEPELLIADEPTTALDVTIQAQVLELLRRLQRERAMALLLITHDLGVVAEMADRVGVMYAGQVVEESAREPFFESPAHPYSRKLFAAVPDASKRSGRLAAIAGMVPAPGTRLDGCRFAARCDVAWPRCHGDVPRWHATVRPGQRARCHLYGSGAPESRPQPARTEPAPPPEPSSAASNLLEVDALSVHFPIHRGVLRRVTGYVQAVDGVSFDIPSGTTLALVGESGCGKTTAGKGIVQLLRPTAGRVRFDGEELTALAPEALRRKRRDIQFIFQDPYASMNPRMSVANIVAEGMVVHGIGATRAERERRVVELLEQVGLGAEARTRYPHEFSGGQRQRICIARALAVAPKLIVCDEPTSALDVSVQAQILNLLKSLQQHLGIAYLFITHNLGVVEYLAHRVAVMYLGRIVEAGMVEEVLRAPRHPYTRALLSAVPVVDRRDARARIRLEGDMPSPGAPPRGCHFHPRCAQAFAPCRSRYPAPTQFSTTHRGRCHLYAADVERVA